MKRRVSILCLAVVARLGGRGQRSARRGPERVADLRGRRRQHEILAARPDHRATTCNRLAVAWRWDSPDNAIVTENRGASCRRSRRRSRRRRSWWTACSTSRRRSARPPPSTPPPANTCGPSIPRRGNANGRPTPATTRAASRTGPTANRRASSCRPATRDLWALDATTGRPIDGFGISGAVDALKGSGATCRAPNTS